MILSLLPEDTQLESALQDSSSNWSTMLHILFEKESIMIRNRVLIASTLVVSLAGASLAATPDQVGTWSGTAKISTFTGGTNKTVTKETIQIETAADNTTTVTVGGVTQLSGLVLYNTTDSFIQYTLPPGNSSFLGTFNYKNNTMKGTSVGFTGAGGLLINTLEVKYKLKKQ
jgi:hypothetical protein